MTASPTSERLIRYLALRAGLLALLAGAGCGAGGRVRRGNAHLEAGRTSAALNAFQDALERRPNDARALLGYARALLESGEPERAIAPARTAWEAGRKGAAAVLAHALVEAGQGASALEAAAEAVDQSPREPGPAMLLAEARLAAGDPEGAAAALEPGLQTWNSPEALALAAWLDVRRGRTGPASELATRASATALDRPLVQAEAAAVFRMIGDGAQARACARTAVDLGLSSERLAREAARRDQGGDREGAIRKLAQARAIAPTNGMYAYDLGRLLLARGLAGQAATELQAALALAPFRDPAVNGVAVAKAGDWPEAERIEKVVRALDALAQARARIGDRKGAAEALQEIVRTRQGNADEWLAVADAWSSAGDPASAGNAVLEAVAADPNHVGARLRLAQAYVASGKPNLAVGHARLAWERDPGNLEIALLLSSLYHERGEVSAARQVLAVAGRRYPQEPRIREALSAMGK